MRSVGRLMLLAAGVACGGSTTPPDAGTGGGGMAAGGAAADCAPGQAEIDQACVQAGVDVCADGFVADGRGGCLPILPDAPCQDGWMAIVGETSCHALEECGDGPWGNIPLEAGTVFVDGSAPAPGLGTQAAPFTTVAEAIMVAPSGGMVAIAAGTYEEALTLTKSVRVWGRCPELVSLDNQFGAGLHIAADDVEIHTVGIAPDGFGVSVDAIGIELDRIWVHDTPDVGVALQLGAVVNLHDSLVERAGGLGVAGVGATLTIERSVIRNTLANDVAPGRAVGMEVQPEQQEPGELIMVATVVSDSSESGVAVIGSSARIERCVIANTKPQADGRFGIGIAVQGGTRLATLELRDTYVESSHSFGLSVLEATASVTRATIDRVQPQPSDGGFGDGIVVLGVAFDASVEVRRSRIAHAARAGIASFDARVLLEGVALECNPVHLNGEMLSRAYEYDVRPGNACWCEDTEATCRVLSSSLAPPQL